MEKTQEKTDIWSIFMYLILYSISGFAIETVFGMITKGVIESRKSFLYGPFCAIYGIGAITMILTLRNQKKIWKIFVYGAILGAIVEYAMSFICEVWFGVKWWDYSDYIFNIQGRTCLFFAISWGVLAIFLMKVVNPHVDNFINILREKKNIFKAVTILLIAFFSIDAILTGYALKVFYYRVSIQNHLNIENKESIENKYAQICTENRFGGFINHYYNDEKMIRTYPNIIISEQNNNMIYAESLVDGIESYYYRLGEVTKKR